MPKVVADSGNLEARGSMLIGSCLAGVAFQKGLGLVHALSHMVGAEHDTHHGLTNAVLLPAVLRFNATAIGPKIEPMVQALGLARTDFGAFHAHICDLLDELGIPSSLQEIGVPSDGIARLAEKAMQDSAAGTNPRSLTRAEVEQALAEALTGAR